MLISLNWLKDFVDIPEKIGYEELGSLLTAHTVEIDGVMPEGKKFDMVVIGKLLEVKKHPNADKLHLTLVDIGKKKLNIVCGADNIEPGQMVPVALSGAKLPNGMEIAEVKVRGEISEGMLCAEDELGLGQDHSGIMILGKGSKIGQNFSDYLGLDDVVFEVDNKSITNRPDLWSHYGVARDISVFLDADLKALDLKTAVSDGKNGGVNVEVEDHALCPRYMAAVVRNVQVKESPAWIRKRLATVGMRPINNIVDITNYVMLELGQPLHAFDRRLADNIIVRNARKGESITTLDGKERMLDINMLVIANDKQPIAIAGVMGGENSEIADETSDIIIESANFSPFSVRKTSQKLGLRTEASMRYEKSLDPNLCEAAMARTLELIKESCPESFLDGRVADKKYFKLDQGPIELDLGWLDRFVGEPLDEDKTVKIFKKLGFGIEKDERLLKVAVPSWRATKDISIREDLAEEVARIYGYDNLKTRMPEVSMNAPEKNRILETENKIRVILAGAPAFSEVYNYSFVNEELLTKLGTDNSTHLRLANPISKTHTLLRQSLAPNLLLSVKTNQARYSRIALFEIARVYMDFGGEYAKKSGSEDVLPHQEKRLGLVYASDAQNSVDEIKGSIEYLAGKFGLEIAYEESENAYGWSDKAYFAEISGDSRIIGYLSKASSKACRNLGIKKKNVFVAEIRIKDIFELYSAKAKRYSEFAKYPPVIRDIAFVVGEEALYNSIRNEIVAFHENIRKAELFDVYRGENIGKGKKNLAFHIVYMAQKTLTSSEVDKIQNALIKRLEKKFGAQVRNF